MYFNMQKVYIYIYIYIYICIYIYILFKNKHLWLLYKYFIKNLFYILLEYITYYNIVAMYVYVWF